MRRRSDAIRERNLQCYVMELEVDGLTVVPPDGHGFPMPRFDDMVQWLLARAQKMIGCRFTSEHGPDARLDFPPTAVALSDRGGPPNQFLIQQLARHARGFRDLAVNPVAVALIRHLIGAHATRFSSHNSFVKWQGDYGYGPGLGLHADQTAVPLTWGRNRCLPVQRTKRSFTEFDRARSE